MDDINALRLHVNVIDFFFTKPLNLFLIYRLYGHSSKFIGNLRNWKRLLQPIEKVSDFKK